MKKLIFGLAVSLLITFFMSTSTAFATVALTTASGSLDATVPSMDVTFSAASEAPVYFGVCDPADSGASFEVYFNGHALSNSFVNTDTALELTQTGAGAVAGVGTYAATVVYNNSEIGPGTFFVAMSSVEDEVIAQLTASCGADFSGVIPGAPGGSIRGLVFLDNNKNGLREVGEPAVQNVYVTVYSSGDWYYKFYTGDDGTYAPVALETSYYAVELTVPAGYVATTPTRIEGIYISSNSRSLSLNNNFGIAPATGGAVTTATTTQAHAYTTTAATNTVIQTAYPGGTYTVRAGDNLFRIALNHGVSLYDLRAVNGLYNNLIYVGQQLLIPGGSASNHVAAQPATTTTAAAPAPVVADTLSTQTAAVDVAADAPAPAAVNVAADAPAAAATTHAGTYMVKPGENLFRIALNHGVTLNELAAANNIINPTLIYVGQMLVIPGQ